MISSEDFFERVRGMVIYSWEIFSQKVGSGLIKINKEASMQLKYSYILQQFIPIVIFDEREKVEIELESTCFLNGKNREIDILIKATNSELVTYTIAIELKCYKEFASSGRPRGAHDIFMKDVYFDLYLLEEYCNYNIANLGISLVMSNYRTSVNPNNRSAKCWVYDISDGTTVTAGTNFCTPIGGYDIDFTLNKNYSFSWSSYGDYWFTKLIGN